MQLQLKPDSRRSVRGDEQGKDFWHLSNNLKKKKIIFYDFCKKNGFSQNLNFGSSFSERNFNIYSFLPTTFQKPKELYMTS